MDIVAEASCYVESDAAGNQFVVLTYVNDVTLSKTGDRRNYEATTLAILAESDEPLVHIAMKSGIIAHRFALKERCIILRLILQALLMGK